VTTAAWKRAAFTVLEIVSRTVAGQPISRAEILPDQQSRNSANPRCELVRHGLVELPRNGWRDPVLDRHMRTPARAVLPRKCSAHGRFRRDSQLLQRDRGHADCDTGAESQGASKKIVWAAGDGTIRSDSSSEPARGGTRHDCAVMAPRYDSIEPHTRHASRKAIVDHDHHYRSARHWTIGRAGTVDKPGFLTSGFTLPACDMKNELIAHL
jgi:hypothetical protein